MSKQRLTDRLIASGISLNDLIHIVNTGDTSQNPYGSSFKGTVQQLATAIGGSGGLFVLTTSGTTGPSTYIGNNLNVPIYANSDTFVTGFTYNPAINRLTIERNQSQPDLYQTINSVSGLSFSNLTDGRVVYVGSGGLIIDQSGFTYDDLTNTLGVNTIGSSGDCVNDLFVSNIHSCSPLNINPLDEGNVYFGSTSGVTIDVTNSSVGIGTSNPQYKLDILDTNSRLYYDPTSVGGSLSISGETNLPRFTLLVPPYLTKPQAIGSMGIRAWDDTIYGGYGEVGDIHIYASSSTNGLNIINQGPGTDTEDYIRFYAGRDALFDPDIHIQGSGLTRGYVGIGTTSPSEKLHVIGKTLINGDLIANKITGTTLNISQTPNNETSVLLNLLSRDGVNGEVKIKTIPNTVTYGLFSQTADGGPVTATNVETSIIGAGVGTLSVPANGFQIGDSFTCALDGLISCLSSSEIEVRVKTLSGVLLADTGIIDLAAATNKSWLLSLYFTIRTLGTAGTASISSGGLFSYIRNGGTQFEGYVLSSINNTTFDTTINNTLVVTVQWNTNNIGNSILSRNFTLAKIY